MSKYEQILSVFSRINSLYLLKFGTHIANQNKIKQFICFFLITRFKGSNQILLYFNRNNSVVKGKVDKNLMRRF